MKTQNTAIEKAIEVAVRKVIAGLQLQQPAPTTKTETAQATIESFEIDKDYISLKLKRLNLKTKTKKGKDMLVLSKTNFFERFKVKIDGKEIEVKASFMIYI